MSESQRTTGVLAVVIVLGSLLGLGVWGALARPDAAPAAREPGVPALPGVSPGPGASAGGTAAPGPSTATTTASPGSSAASAADSLPPVDWDSMDYPLDCAGAGTAVQRVFALAVAGRPRPLAVVEVRCDAGAGSPPSAVLLFDPAGSGQAPVLVQTLLQTSDDVLVTSLRTDRGAVEVAGTTYSSAEVPRCCPDRTYRRTWRWTGDRLAGD